MDDTQVGQPDQTAARERAFAITLRTVKVVLISVVVGWILWSAVTAPSSYRDELDCTPTGFMGANECG